jgi:hypothetical protein
VAHARAYDAESHVQAMDIEGIDVGILYGTRGLVDVTGTVGLPAPASVRHHRLP